MDKAEVFVLSFRQKIPGRVTGVKVIRAVDRIYACSRPDLLNSKRHFETLKKNITTVVQSLGMCRPEDPLDSIADAVEDKVLGGYGSFDRLNIKAPDYATLGPNVHYVDVEAKAWDTK